MNWWEDTWHLWQEGICGKNRYLFTICSIIYLPSPICSWQTWSRFSLLYRVEHCYPWTMKCLKQIIILRTRVYKKANWYLASDHLTQAIPFHLDAATSQFVAGLKRKSTSTNDDLVLWTLLIWHERTLGIF